MKPKHVALGFVVAIIAHAAILIAHAAQKPTVKESLTVRPLRVGPVDGVKPLTLDAGLARPVTTMTLIAERDGVKVWSLQYKGTETLITSVGEIRRVP